MRYKMRYNQHTENRNFALFTFVLWFRENTQCEVIINDHLKHAGFNNYYKIAVRNHVRVQKFWHT